MARHWRLPCRWWPVRSVTPRLLLFACGAGCLHAASQAGRLQPPWLQCVQWPPVAHGPWPPGWLRQPWLLQRLQRLRVRFSHAPAVLAAVFQLPRVQPARAHAHGVVPVRVAPVHVPGPRPGAAFQLRWRCLRVAGAAVQVWGPVGVRAAALRVLGPALGAVAEVVEEKAEAAAEQAQAVAPPPAAPLPTAQPLQRVQAGANASSRPPSAPPANPRVPPTPTPRLWPCQRAAAATTGRVPVGRCLLRARPWSCGWGHTGQLPPCLTLRPTRFTPARCSVSITRTTLS